MRNFIFALATFSGLHLSAQHFCSTTEEQNKWFSQHPDLKEAFEKRQQELAEQDRELYQNGYQIAGKTSAAGIYTIPVVFHILHQGGGENISDAQVIDAVNILTRDFNATNADTASVVSQFKNLIGNAQIDFVLATKDPNGNCTNGIVRHYDANTNWTNSQANYAYTWPPSRYMNIYVVRTMGSGAAGYTYLPGSGIPQVMDAIVILHNYVGSIGTGNTSLSRALTHEVGHWLNLPHTWGNTNQPGVACGDDGVSDTPVTRGFTSCNLSNASICTPGVVENMQNYMDYAYCQRMFTIGQAIRVQNAINSPVSGRNNLSSPANLAFTGVTSPGTGCVPKVSLVPSPSYTVCSGKSLVVTSYTSNAIPTSYQWSVDNAASVASPTAASTSVTFLNPGLTQVSCLVSNANGSASQTINITVLDGTPDITSSYYESFESAQIAPPTHWQTFSPSNQTDKWEIMTLGGSEGFVSMFVPGESLNPNTIVILESPSFDFKNNPGAQFSFKHAYAMQSSSHKDVFKVQASRNCGGSWTDVWVPSSTSLAQNSGGITSDLYFPYDSDWKLKNLTQQPQFYPFTTEDHVRIRFFFQENVGGTTSGNRFYLDEIQFAQPVGINEMTRSVGFNVYPNPASSVVHLDFRLSAQSRVSYQISSATGAAVISGAETLYQEGAHTIAIDTHAHQLAPGIYFVNMELNGFKMSRKIVVE